MSRRDTITRELENIRVKAGGMLHPAAVVDTARNPAHPLHGEFTWDDTEAAERYRLTQARQLIRMCVDVVSSNSQPVNLYVSLREDRTAGAGYRHIVDVMNDARHRQNLLHEALRDLAQWRRKYCDLIELAKAFEAVDAELAEHPEAPPPA